ncbi:MAG: glycerophosphodiester phosphodiesterase [Actinobacteria bacterium]|nr:glycerophosphodiester phosphodiesterase [Actinomycetota bacterium]
MPEVDVRTSKDGVFFCLHDTSLARTTNAPDEIKNLNAGTLSFKEIRKWDAGVKFSSEYAGTRVPSLTEIFVAMNKNSERMIYLDIKNIDLKKLKKMIDQFAFEKRIIFVNGNRQMLVKLKKVFPLAKTMTWLSGSPEQIKDKFKVLRATNFRGIDQLQFHLKVKSKKPEITYLLSDKYLISVLNILRRYHAELQVRPFEYDALSLKRLMNLGIRWFVTNSPQKFYQTIQQALMLEMGTLLFLQSAQNLCASQS